MENLYFFPDYYNGLVHFISSVFIVPVEKRVAKLALILSSRQSPSPSPHDKSQLAVSNNQLLEKKKTKRKKNQNHRESLLYYPGLFCTLRF